MKKHTGQEWVLFRNQAGRIQFNPICHGCKRRCKQTFRAEIVRCSRYESRKRHQEQSEM